MIPSRLRPRRAAPPLALLALIPLLACGDDPVAPGEGTRLEVSFQNVPMVHPDQGTLEVWVHGGPDTVSVGRIAATPAGAGSGATLERWAFELPLSSPDGAFVTLEAPGDGDPAPSRSVFLHGDFRGAAADLVLEGAMSDGRPLQPEPGAHSLFTTSNNAEEGYPSAEAAGLWLFTLTPSRNVHRTREVRVTPLEPGWTYEGWIVRQSVPEVWISYGKFRPDELGLLTSRDDTGTGPFSGVQDYRNGGVEDVPGEEWTTTRVADVLGFELPAGLATPLLLDQVDAGGEPVWHHVITIEPAFDLAEAPLEGRPFVARPYENAIGPDGPGVPRTILFREDRLPRARVAPAGGVQGG